MRTRTAFHVKGTRASALLIAAFVTLPLLKPSSCILVTNYLFARNVGAASSFVVRMSTTTTSNTLPEHRTVCCYGDDASPDTTYPMTTRPMPQLSSPKHVLVQVKAAGLNPVDAKHVIGDKLPHSWNRLKGWFKRQYLHDKIPGFDFSGVVVQTYNSSSTSFAAGDAVFGTVPPFVGTVCDYLIAPIDQICHKPNKLTWEEAAALPLVGLTCYQLMRPHNIQNKSVLVVGGSGGTGHIGLQMARVMGAKHVVAVCSDANRDFCINQCHATEVISYQYPDLRSMLQKSAASPFSLVLDCVTSADPRDVAAIHYPSFLQQEPSEQNDSPSLLTPDYVYRRLGGPSMDWIRAGLERTIGLEHLLWGNEHEKLFWIRFPQSSSQLQQLREWADAGTIKPRIERTYGFTSEGIRDAMGALMSRRVRGKVVVVMDQDKPT